MTRALSLGIVCLSIVTAVSAAGAASARGGTRRDGHGLYVEYCSSCHGLDARGKGPDADIFTAPPRDLREGFLKTYKGEDLVRRVLDGKPLELAVDLTALRRRASQVEDLVSYMKRLPGINWEQIGDAQVLYVERCSECHGAFGRPGPSLPAGVRAPRDLSDPDVQRSINDRDLVTLVRHGRKEMPALTPRIKEEEAKGLAPFVRLLSPGFEVYTRYCASCHGDDGHGAGSLAEELQRPSVVFDRAYFKHHDAEQLRTSVWHMVGEATPQMPHYRAVLQPAQARAIVEYLKRLH